MITRFEELKAWQMARELTKRIYSISDRPGFKVDYRFRAQIRAASLSVSSNIAEGFERGSQPEFIRFLTIARGSCAEVRSQLYSALDVGHVSKEEFTTLLDYAEQVGRIIGALRQSAMKSKT
ncbi:MAG TPA: four helix bundle protein [Candidatus Kapabacteria bacterium]|jgi:four helix bundle protein